MENLVPTVCCTKCGRSFPRTVEYFHRQKGRPDGLRSWCKECNCADARRWGSDNREYARAAARAYAKRHRAEACLWHASWARTNPDKVRKIQHAYWLRHIDRLRQAARERYHWKRCINTSELWSDQGGRCYYCNVRLEMGNFDVDHIMPRARGGLDVLGNTCLSCLRCNRSKRHRTPKEFFLGLPLGTG